MITIIIIKIKRFVKGFLKFFKKSFKKITASKNLP